MMKGFVVLLVLVLLTGFAGMAGAVQYNMIDLGSYGGTFNYAYGINDYGQVVGASEHTNYGMVAFIWDSTNGMQRIAATDDSTYARSINNNGQVVGYLRTSTGYYSQPFRWDSTSGIHNIGSVYYPGSEAWSINSSGTITGNANINQYTTHVVIWGVNDKLTDIKTLPGGIIVPAGEIPFVGGYGECINDNGVIVGCAKARMEINSSTYTRAFMYDPTVGMIDIGYINTGNEKDPLTVSTLHTVNNKGIAAGKYGSKAMFWSRTGGIQLLPSLGSGGGEVFGINESNVMVGSSNGRACVWYGTDSVQDLGWGTAYAINENGWIAGWASVNGGTHAVVWAPVPEPSSIIALVSGICGFGGLAIRKRK